MECILSWIMFFMGIAKGNPLYFIASGVYACAAYLCYLKK